MGRLDLEFGGRSPEAGLRRIVRCSWLVAVRDQQPEPGGNDRRDTHGHQPLDAGGQAEREELPDRGDGPMTAKNATPVATTSARRGK